jgi:hypothetical protein
MCDYSLQNVKSRPAKVGDKLTTQNFGTGTRGFAASEDANVAVCVLPGTELSFSSEVTCQGTGLFGRNKIMKHTIRKLATRAISPIRRGPAPPVGRSPSDAVQAYPLVTTGLCLCQLIAHSRRSSDRANRPWSKPNLSPTLAVSGSVEGHRV